jgi:hypothetical protein
MGGRNQKLSKSLRFGAIWCDAAPMGRAPGRLRPSQGRRGSNVEVVPTSGTNRTRAASKRRYEINFFGLKCFELV